MDPETLSALGVKFEWVGDRIATMADIKPRHIGRPVTFDLVVGSDSHKVTGTLEGVVGNVLMTASSDYDSGSIENVRVWRRAVVRPDERSAR